MEKEFALLVEIMKKFEGFELKDTSLDPPWIHFAIKSEFSLTSITEQVAELKSHHDCSILLLGTPEDIENVSYQLVIDGNHREATIAALTKKFTAILEAQGDARKARMTELGLPDLTLVTIRQMASELKHRANLTFALVWIENNDRDNIAIEGSGNPTQLVGLLARGQHMAIEWADKNIKFSKPKDD